MKTHVWIVSSIMLGASWVHAQDTPPASTDAPAFAETPVVQPAASEAPAEPAQTTVYTSTETDTARDVSFSIAPHIGVLVPQLFSDLNSWPIFGLELGYILPFDVGSMKRPLQLTLDGMYSQPGADGDGFSPWLGEDGQAYGWELTQRMVILEFAALWRFMPPADGFSVYALIGPRMYLLETVMVASSEGVDFGENRETQTHFGMVIGGGVEYPLGPGSLFGGLEFGWSDLNTAITGDSNTGTLVVDLGYRLMF